MPKNPRRNLVIHTTDAISTKESRKTTKRSFGKGKKSKSRKKSKGK